MGFKDTFALLSFGNIAKIFICQGPA